MVPSILQVVNVLRASVNWFRRTSLSNRRMAVLDELPTHPRDTPSLPAPSAHNTTYIPGIISLTQGGKGVTCTQKQKRRRTGTLPFGSRLPKLGFKPTTGQMMPPSSTCWHQSCSSFAVEVQCDSRHPASQNRGVFIFSVQENPFFYHGPLGPCAGST
jgi:hypothetical protein